jgi:hypothetical protein
MEQINLNNSLTTEEYDQNHFVSLTFEMEPFGSWISWLVPFHSLSFCLRIVLETLGLITGYN